MTLSLFLYIVVIFILVLLSGFSSATEAAYLAASRAKLHRLRKSDVHKVSIAIHLKEKIEQVVSSLLICNTLVNILASSIATGVMISLWGEAGVVYASAIMTILIVIFAEVVPKFYAMRRAESYSIAVAPTLKLLLTLAIPLTYGFEWSARMVLKACGVSIKPGEIHSSSLEELRGMIDLHQGDEETLEERAMLRSVLELGDVAVEEIMVHRKDMKLLNVDDPLEKIMEELVDSHHTRLPIYQGDPDNIIGIIHAKKFLRLVKDQQEKLTPEDILESAKKPWFVPETTTLFEQLQAFRKRREHMALVVDEYGSLQGIVTLEDIIEEIVGDIDDEHDPNQTGFWQNLAGDVFSVGATTLRDLNRQFNWDLPDEDAATLAGLIMHESHAIPKIGQTFRIHGFKMKILRRLKNQITLIKIAAPKHLLPQETIMRDTDKPDQKDDHVPS
jgi:Mg2+/Co2+ transporter CorB